MAIVVGIVAGLLLIVAITCICCCCRRYGRWSRARANRRHERDQRKIASRHEEMNQRQEQRRMERRAQTDVIRQKYGRCLKHISITVIKLCSDMTFSGIPSSGPTFERVDNDNNSES